jgi:putative endonuclease
MRISQLQKRESHNKETGDLGEWVAADFLKRLGFQILEKNYRFGRAGEIDIVAIDGDVLVFCEVKARSDDRYGEPECAITLAKQKQVRYLAKVWLYQHAIDEQECRFDVVAITFRRGCAEINYLKGAF